MKTIPLTNGGEAMVDDSDFQELSRYKWRRNDHGYAVRQTWCSGKNIKVRMQRQIMKAPPGIEVDHRDEVRLNNQRYNLRLATHAQNLCNRGKNRNNTSGFKGAFLHKPSGKFLAQICVNRRRIYLGYFPTAEEAHAAYAVAASQYHGEFAKL